MASRLARERRVEPAASAIIPSAKCVGSYRQLSQSARHGCLGTQLGKVSPILVGEAADPQTGGRIGFPF